LYIFYAKFVLFTPNFFDRSCLINNSSEDRRKKQLLWEEVSDHPLKPLVVTVIVVSITCDVMYNDNLYW